MRVCDIVASFLEKQAKVKDIFMVSGGGLLFLTDGLLKNKNLNKICCHHEQAASMSAVAYAKYKQDFGCVYLTTGCGGTNAMTALLHAWQDNTPCIFISGQCKRIETLRIKKTPIRQIGVQEADIISLVEPITKYSVMIDEPKDILFHLEKALYMAKEGRPGPVWLDIPSDVQGYAIDNESSLRHFYANQNDCVSVSIDDIKYLQNEIQKAKRPIIIAGQGIRLSHSIQEFYDFIHKYQIPIVSSRMGFDAMPTEDDLYIGRIGTKGTRAGNFAIQNADLIVAMGSRLSVSSTGHEYDLFAPKAKIIAIDIDKHEHTKNTIKIDKVINANIKEALKQLSLNISTNKKWLDYCFNIKKKYPLCLPEYYNDDSNGINLYVFMEELSKKLKKDSVVVTDAGSAVYVPAQSLKTTTMEQRYITSGAQAEMGFTLPGAIGVCFAKNKSECLAITGDGSLQMNIQELQTLVYYNLPIKLFVWNNDGYLSIRSSQDKLFDGNLIGTDSSNGVSFPDLEKIAYAYGIKYIKIDKIADLPEKLDIILAEKNSVIVDVISIKNQLIAPAVSSKKMPDGTFVSQPLENMYPFLPEDEVKENMIND